MSQFEWKEYGMSVVVSNTGPKQYGLVRLKNGGKRYRNYRRELKNGKGLSFADLLIQRKLENQIRMDMELMSRVFT